MMQLASFDKPCGNERHHVGQIVALVALLALAGCATSVVTPGDIRRNRVDLSRTDAQRDAIQTHGDAVAQRVEQLRQRQLGAQEAADTLVRDYAQLSDELAGIEAKLATARGDKAALGVETAKLRAEIAAERARLAAARAAQDSGRIQQATLQLQMLERRKVTLQRQVSLLANE